MNVPQPHLYDAHTSEGEDTLRERERSIIVISPRSSSTVETVLTQVVELVMGNTETKHYTHEELRGATDSLWEALRETEQQAERDESERPRGDGALRKQDEDEKASRRNGGRRHRGTNAAAKMKESLEQDGDYWRKVVTSWLLAWAKNTHQSSRYSVSVELTREKFWNPSMSGLRSYSTIATAKWSHDAGHVATINHTLTAYVDEGSGIVWKMVYEVQTY